MSPTVQLRARSASEETTLCLDVAPDCTLSRLKELIAVRIGGAAANVTVSVNRREELSGSPGDTLISLGVVESGGIVFYATDPGVFAPKALTLGGPGSVDVGIIDRGPLEAVDEALVAMKLSEASIGGSEAEPARSAACNWRSTPSYGFSLLVAAVNAVLVDSGLARLDVDTGEPVRGIQLPGPQGPPGMECFLRYTLDKMAGSSKSNSALPQIIIVKVYQLGSRFIAACRSLDDPCYAVKLEEPSGWHYAVKMAMALSESRGGRADDDDNDMLLNVLHQEDLFEFYKDLKDKLAMPILIELCETAGLRRTPCLTRLPIELKLKIFVLVRAADLAKLACVCRELREVASDNSLWRIKFAQVFEDAGGSGNIHWKQRFVNTFNETREKMDQIFRIYRTRLNKRRKID
uniref:F-box domain-containing protein n=1 Tax=Kalanchoe fedtschenkoi TaxID=63787 RepID=A0A7N0TMU0_KALFE